MNEGPIIEREPVDKEISRGEYTNHTNNAFTCAARNALSVQVRCSPKNLSEPQPLSTVTPTTVTETTGQGVHTTAENASGQKQSEANNSGGSLVVPSSALVDLVDPMTGVRHIEIQAIIDDRIFGKFPNAEDGRPIRTLFCTCYAWSSKGQVISRVATVKLTEGEKQRVLML